MTRSREKAPREGPLTAAMAWQGRVSRNKCSPFTLSHRRALSFFHWPHRTRATGSKDDGEGWRADPEQQVENIQASVG